MEHTFYVCDGKKCADSQHCHYCDGGLASCTVCGGGEGTLLPTCPGYKLSSELQDAIMAGQVRTVDDLTPTDEDKRAMAEAGGIAERDLPAGAAEASRNIRLRVRRTAQITAQTEAVRAALINETEAGLKSLAQHDMREATRHLAMGAYYLGHLHQLDPSIIYGQSYLREALDDRDDLAFHLFMNKMIKGARAR